MEQTKKQLIEKTIQFIEQEGYQNLSLRKLTKEIGLSTGAFYQHFKNKNELFKEVTIKLSQDFIKQINFKNSNPVKQLLQIADFFISEVNNHPHKMDFLFFNEEALRALTQNQQAFPFLTKINSLIDQLELKDGLSKQEFFVQIWSFIQGYALLVKNQVTEYNPQLIKLTLTKMLNKEN